MANDFSLKAVFGGDTGPLEQSIKRATAAVGSFASGIKGKIGGAAAGGFKDLVAPVAGVVASVASVGAVMAGVKSALDLGGELTDLSNRTGIAVESLYGLRQAFKDSGMEASAIGPAVGKMQKALASAASGGKEADVLQSLGLDAQSLASANPADAFTQIGTAIAALPNSTERAAASMAIFGKSGAELLQVFMDPNFKNAGNISETAKMLGENAGAFDKVGDSFGRVGEKLNGLFIGIGAGMVGVLDAISEFIDKLDLSAIGKSLGEAIATAIAIFTNGDFSTIVENSFAIGVKDGLNFLSESITGLPVMSDSAEERRALSAAIERAKQTAQAMNADTRAENANRGVANQDFNAADIGGQERKSTLIADSLAKIGGGGSAVGGGNAILDETKRQTGLQQQMVQQLTKLASAKEPVAQFAA